MADSRAQLLQLLLFSVIATLAGSLLVAFTNPASAGLTIKLLVLLVIGFTAGSWASLVGFTTRLVLKRHAEYRPFAASVRQGVLIAVLVMALLILQVIGLFTWWIILTVVLLILVLELFLNL